MSDPKRYGFPMCECDATDEFHMQEMGMAELKDGGFVLWNDYARLKAEVERLRKAAVTGGYNLSEYIRMANSETLEFDNGDIFAEMTLPERIKYIVESHARLKAEVERLKIYDYKNLSMRIEIDKLNAKINRLVKAGDKMVLCIDGDYNYQMPCVQAWNAAKDGKTSE